MFVINAFGVPNGLMRYLYRPEALSAERKWYWYTEKTWATHRYFLGRLRTQSSNLFINPLPVKKIVNHIMTVKSDQQVIEQKCTPRNWSPSSDECIFELRVNKYSIDVRRNLTHENGRVIECTMDECNSSFFINNGTKFTIESLLELYA